MQIRTITLRCSYSGRSAFYFQRPVPIDLQPHYGKKLMKVNLRTSDMGVAAKQISRVPPDGRIKADG
ncbi:DUF6538 domain-containing protein [Caballeronia sordidicola]|uniref:DUF6538 domain-containing protein n=1 Tax=Caballeronia sordidicola TaxID=196367 RepID=UPI003AF31E5B